MVLRSRRRMERRAVAATALAALTTAVFGGFLITHAAKLDTYGLIQVGVLFLASLALTSCLGVGVLVCRAVDVLINSLSAALLLQQVVADQDPPHRPPLRVVDRSS